MTKFKYGLLVALSLVGSSLMAMEEVTEEGLSESSGQIVSRIRSGELKFGDVPEELVKKLLTKDEESEDEDGSQGQADNAAKQQTSPKDKKGSQAAGEENSKPEKETQFQIKDKKDDAPKTKLGSFLSTKAFRSLVFLGLGSALAYVIYKFWSDNIESDFEELSD